MVAPIRLKTPTTGLEIALGIPPATPIYPKPGNENIQQTQPLTERVARGNRKRQNTRPHTMA
jgi:hypothetical protein